MCHLKLTKCGALACGTSHSLESLAIPHPFLLKSDAGIYRADSGSAHNHATPYSSCGDLLGPDCSLIDSQPTGRAGRKPRHETGLRCFLRRWRYRSRTPEFPENGGGRGGGEAQPIGRLFSGLATAGERRPDQATREEPVGWPLPPEQLPAGCLCRDRPSLL